MTKKLDNTTAAALPRRSLLIGLPTMGATVALSPRGSEASTAPPVSEDADPRLVRLKDTDHVRTYYALARR